MPSSGKNRQPGNRVEARYFRSTKPGEKGLVIVLPIWGYPQYISRTLAKRLRAGETSAGDVNVLLLRGRRHLVDWRASARASSEAEFRAAVERAAGAIETTVRDLVRVVDWAVARPEIDPERIGIVGMSVSAPVALLAMGKDDRIAAGVLLMGGGDLVEALASCRCQPGRVRKPVTKRFGWSSEAYQRVLEEGLGSLRLLEHAAAIDRERVLIAEARDDECFPAPSRAAYYEALGLPERYLLHAGHRRAFLGSMTFLGRTWLTRGIVRFLEDRLGKSSDRIPI